MHYICFCGTVLLPVGGVFHGNDLERGLNGTGPRQAAVGTTSRRYSNGQSPAPCYISPGKHSIIVFNFAEYLNYKNKIITERNDNPKAQI